MQDRGALSGVYVTTLVVMILTLHFIAVVTGCFTVTPSGTCEVQIEINGARVLLAVDLDWTEREVIAALEAKTGRSFRGCYLVAPGARRSEAAKRPGRSGTWACARTA